MATKPRSRKVACASLRDEFVNATFSLRGRVYLLSLIHIYRTLGSWFRDYVYIPLGGNRKGLWRTLRNLMLVWGLTGFWHGASLSLIHILPWMRVAQECGAVVQYVPLDAQGRITLEAVASMMNERVRVVALAHISNVLGYLAPMREICELAHRYGAVVVVDGAQSVPHIPLDVVAMDCDFLAFSAHKMCGPTGIGILYGKLELLDLSLIHI